MFSGNPLCIGLFCLASKNSDNRRLCAGWDALLLDLHRLMTHTVLMNIIAHIYCGLPEKFGVPRQSGLAQSLKARIVFTPEYRSPEAVRGLDGFSHIWLLWNFSAVKEDVWSPTVRPPRLGGNVRIGVFATRSPFRPNPIGLSCVRLEKIDLHASDGPILHVSGVDLMDGTPIWDIKPYIPYADCHLEAAAGFTESLEQRPLRADFPDPWRTFFSREDQKAVCEILELDPRPRYHDDPERVYGMTFKGWNVRFTVRDGVAEVCGVEQAERKRESEMKDNTDREQ
ncbi:MAG: tRNA (N6-threonylcarbamoyladenosine(37)-N6)-methyltransferase TrmO [Desulfovibrionaceae bacterium]|nr:tRNA (N6-threonylcarbamoyladenosine(37)-N6)-methyltransferase TrmO [Desulfovibrionaceae bacterium]